MILFICDLCTDVWNEGWSPLCDFVIKVEELSTMKQSVEQGIVVWGNL